MLEKKIRSRVVRRALAISVWVGLAIGIFSTVQSLAAGVKGSLLTAQTVGGFGMGFTITFFYAILANFFTRNSAIRSLPFLVFTGLQLVSLSALVLTTSVIFGYLMRPDQFLSSDTIVYQLVFSLGVGLAITFLESVRSFAGGNFLKNFLRGSYHTPKEEVTIVCFVDLRGSTGAAESMGSQLFFQYLNAFLATIEDCAFLYSGEIYKYVGDGVILIWKASDQNFKKSFAFLVELREALFDRRRKKVAAFERPFEFTCGIHAGKLLVCEIGSERREIGYWGDTINTAQRVQSYCSEAGTWGLCSDEYLERLFAAEPGLRGSRPFDALADVPLKGKRKTVTLYKIE